MDVLDVVMVATNVVGFVCLVLSLRGSVAPWRTCGVFAVGNCAAAAQEIMQGRHAMIAFNGPVCVACAWLWWKGGGGDGTRRRLRSLARAFRGVRRTAPATGSAS